MLSKSMLIGGFYLPDSKSEWYYPSLGITISGVIEPNEEADDQIEIDDENYNLQRLDNFGILPIEGHFAVFIEDSFIRQLEEEGIPLHLPQSAQLHTTNGYNGYVAPSAEPTTTPEFLRQIAWNYIAMKLRKVSTADTLWQEQKDDWLGLLGHHADTHDVKSFVAAHLIDGRPLDEIVAGDGYTVDEVKSFIKNHKFLKQHAD
jgi:hypothetical protein